MNIFHGDPLGMSMTIGRLVVGIVGIALIYCAAVAALLFAIPHLVWIVVVGCVTLGLL